MAAPAPPTTGAAAGSAYFGSKISLITKSEIRYEGTLYSINPQESTVALQSVRVMGTEGRRGGQGEVPPDHVNVFEFIVFRGTDIKDLTVVETASATAPAQPQVNDPAVMQSAPAAPAIPAGAPPAAAAAAAPAVPPSSFAEAVSGKTDAEPGAARAAPVPAAAPAQRGGGHGNRRGESGPGGRRGGRGGGGGRPRQPMKFDGDFDFESANARLNKDDLFADIGGDGGDAGNDAARYNKSQSFFDSISCETLEKQGDREPPAVETRRQERADERQRNLDTFGQAYVPRRRGRGRGRGRGGRGGRGGYDRSGGNRGSGEEGERQSYRGRGRRENNREWRSYPMPEDAANAVKARE